MLLYFLLTTIVFTVSAKPPQSDDLFILLDEINVYSCRGVKNEIKLEEDDVSIKNEKGNRVYYIRAPGNYSLNFKNIRVTDDFGYLSGEIGVTLQVPLLEGPGGIRFDLPYTMIPETGLLNQQCDEFSGIVERDGRQYCRYCDICELSEKVESGLINNGHTYLPGVASGSEERFSPKCSHISADTYEFKRTINLPGKKELEQKVKDKMQGLDAEIQKRLNKGRGRFQVFLNLITANHPPIKQKTWFDGSSQCRCCGKHRDASCRNMLSFLYCNNEDCKSAWAQQCLHNSARIAACYTVEFNYRMTTAYSDVLQFLRENKYPNQDQGVPHPSTTPEPYDQLNPEDKSSESEPESNSDKSSLSEADKSDLSEACTAKMPKRLTHLRRYCTIFWNPKLCCSYCEGIC